MAYTIKQLTMAWTAVHNGIAPEGTALADLQNKAAQNAAGALTDAQTLAWVINSADNSTALAVLSYQFFTGKSPTEGGLDYLVNSPTNPNDLNDAYYDKFNLENRYINFAANLGVVGEGAAAFSSKYGAMSFATYIASIYETIIGASYAKAAGIDPAAAVAYVVSRYDAILATAKSAGMITPNMTQAQIDLAVKAAAAGFLMGEAIKADVGLYAAAANNFMLALAEDKAVYNTDITTTYKPVPGSGSQGTGGAVDAAPPADTLPGAVEPPKPAEPEPLHFSLTTGTDKFTGKALDDTFSGTATTLNAGDVLNGGGGNDTLTINAGFNGNYTPAAATLISIETVNITNANSGVYVDASGWTSVTKLTVTDKESTQVTASATQDVKITNTSQTGFTFIANGGHDVTISIADSEGTIRVGQTTAPTGAVVFSRTSSVANPGSLEITGGASIDVTLTAANAVNTTQFASATLHGTTLTTLVKVKGSAAVTADANTAGHSGDSFQINDVNRGASGQAGKIATVEANGFGSLTISDNALATLKASNGGNIQVGNNAAGAAAATTLNATLSNIDGTFQDNGVYTTLNLTRGAAASDIDLNMNVLTTLTISGSGALTLSSTTATLLETITVTGSGAFDAGDLVGFGSLTTFDASAASGAINLIVDAGVTAVSTGSGADTIEQQGGAVTEAMSLGGGDDTFYLGGYTTSAAIDGGQGTDIIWLDGTTAAAAAGSATFSNLVTGFERLHIDNGNNETIDVAALGGYHYVEVEDGAGVTLDGLSAGDTLVLMKSGTSYVVGAGNFGGASDSFNLRLETDGSGAKAYGSVGLSGVETVIITLDDSRATPTGSALNSVEVLDSSAKTITVSGDAGLDLTAASTALTSVDASGITKGDFKWTSGGLAGAATIKGSASGENELTLSAATAAVTYEGGAGNDTVFAINSVSGNVIHLGEGVNYFKGGATTITAGAGDDYVQLTTGGATIHAGDGDNLILATSTTTASIITTGSGDDRIFVDGAANDITIGAGDDEVEIDGVNAASATVFNSITGMGADDQLIIIDNNANGFGAQLTGHTSVADYLAVANDVAGTNNTLRWFVIGADLYILSDVSDSTSFVQGADSVIKLVGGASLDMAAAQVTGGAITF